MLIRCDPFPDCRIPSETKVTIIRHLGGDELLVSLIDSGKADLQPVLGLHATLYLIHAYEILEDLKKAKPNASLNASYTRLKDHNDLICDSAQYVDDRDYTFSNETGTPPAQQQLISSGCYFYHFLSRLAAKSAIRLNIPKTLVLGFGEAEPISIESADTIVSKTVKNVQAEVRQMLSEANDFALVREQFVSQIAPGTFSVSESIKVVRAKDERDIDRVLHPAPGCSVWLQKVLTPRKWQYTRLRLCLFPAKDTGFLITPKSNPSESRISNPQNSILNYLPDSILSQSSSAYGLRTFIGLQHHHPVTNFPAAEQRNLIEVMKLKLEVMEFFLIVLKHAKEVGLPHLSLGTTNVLYSRVHGKLAALRSWLSQVYEPQSHSPASGLVLKRAIEEVFLGLNCSVYPLSNLNSFSEPLSALKELREAINSELQTRKVTVLVADFMQEVSGHWCLLEVHKVDTEARLKPKVFIRGKNDYSKCAGDFCRLVGTCSPEQQSKFAQLLLRKGFTNASIYLSDRNQEHAMLWETHHYKIMRKVILDERCDSKSLSKAVKLMKGERPGDYRQTSWGTDTVSVCYLCYLLYTKFESALPGLTKSHH